MSKLSPQFSLETTWGVWGVSLTAEGVSGVWFPCAAHRRLPPLGADGMAGELRRFFAAYLAGSRLDPGRVRRDFSGATPFQRVVWEELGRIPYGQVRTYGEVAHRIGRPRASRAVGGACADNRLPVLVPCHRVVAAGGKLGGFGGGRSLKKRLLEWEGWNGALGFRRQETGVFLGGRAGTGRRLPGAPGG